MSLSCIADFRRSIGIYGLYDIIDLNIQPRRIYNG
jgi:hypothetical protein